MTEQVENLVRMGIYRHVLRAASHFCATDNNRPTLEGIHIQKGDDSNIVVTATNGFILFRCTNGGEIHHGDLPENGIIFHHRYVNENLKGKIVMEKVDLFKYTDPPKTLQNGDEKKLDLIYDPFPNVGTVIASTLKGVESSTEPLTQLLGLDALGLIVNGLSDFHGRKKKFGGIQNDGRTLKCNFAGNLRPMVMKTVSSAGTSALVLAMPHLPSK